MSPLNEGMLKYQQNALEPVPMERRITISVEKQVCTEMALLFVDREKRARERAMLFATLVVFHDF